MNSILVLLTLITIHQACSPLPENILRLTTISDEVVRLKLNSLFSNNDYHNITRLPVIDQFQIISPIEQVQQSPLQEKELVASKYYKSTKSQMQFHQIALLYVGNGNYDVSYNSKVSTQIPEIDQQINQISKPDSICYDLIRLGDEFVVDCSDSQGDYFVLVSNELTYIPIIKSQEDRRKLDQMNNYIFRSTIIKLELYEYSNGLITPLKTLDQVILITLLNKPDFKFLIREFKTHINVQVSILNWSGELLILQYQNNQWILINCVYTNEASFSYDIDIENNTFVILMDVKIYYKSITGQEYSIFFPDYDAKNKIFLTQDFIILQEKSQISLYSQYLNVMDKIKVKETDQLLRTRQNGFLLISNDKLIKYALNQDYYLQAILNKIEENYQFISIYQTSNQNCRVYIEFKAVSLNNTEIFYTQVPSTLITQAIFDKSQDIIIRDIFQGPNLKYNFQNTDLLTVSVLQTLPVTISGIYQDVVYRKIIYAPTIYNNVYLIQQDEIFRITTYTCETNTRTQLKCQQMNTASTISKTLKDSPNQLWWLNYDSLFLAIAFGSKLDIYYLNYKGQSFELLQTLNLEGDIKQITTDGQLLFVLVDVTVHIYTVTTQDKVQQISTILGADSIYSTQNKDGHLFILYLQTLSLYIINQTQQTLIWQEQFTFDQINVALFLNQFVILIEQGKKYQGVVYNYQNEAHIYWEKQISFYEYTNIQLGTIQTNIVNNLLYIRGVSKLTFKDFILVYDINTQGQNSLFIILEYSLNTQLTQASNFLFLLDSDKIANNFYITGQNFGHVTVRQDYRQVNYTTLNPLKVKVNNNEKTYQYDQPLSLVNRGEHIFQTLEKVELIINNQNNCADLGQKWYSGQVMDFTMTNSSQLTFKNSLEKQEEELNFSAFMDNFNENYLIQVITNKVVLINKQDLKQIEFTMEKEITNLLFVYNDLVFVEVTFADWYYLNIIKCTNQQCSMIEDSQQYQQKLKKVFIDERYFFLTIGSTIKVYDYKADILNPKKYILIDTIKPFRYSPYIEIKHMYDNVYHFYSIDQSGQILIQTMYQFQSPQTKNQFIGYDIREMIKSLNIYTPDNMLPSGLFIIPNNDFLELLIVFSQFASISLKFTVDCSKELFCDTTPVQQATIYQQYGAWYTFPMYTSAYVNENILSRVFINQNTFQYELFLYDIESNDNLKYTIASIESPVMKMPPEFYQIMSFVYIYNGQLHLLASAENKDKLNHYHLLRSSQLCSNESKIEDNVTFQLKNKDEQLNVQLNIKLSPYVPPPPPDDNHTSTFPYWVIVPIILAVAALGFLGYKCYQKKNKVDEDRLLMA